MFFFFGKLVSFPFGITISLIFLEGIVIPVYKGLVISTEITILRNRLLEHPHQALYI